MSDQIVINVITDPPTNINISDTGENVYLNPLTLNQGIINHSVTHQAGGSDELSHNLLGGLQGGTGSQYYHLTQSQYNNLVTGAVVRPSETGQFYPSSNPSGFITGVDLSNYATTGFVTGASGFLQNQISVLNNQTGTYVTGEVVRQSQTGQFYPANNPSGFITGVDLSNYATIPFVSGISGDLQSGLNVTNQKLSTAVFVTGNQDISGLKDFQTRPTVLDVPVLVSGDAVDTIHLYGKNDQGATIYKGQPVYINSANGNNPLIQLASNTGERTSSKTIGLLAQDLAVNEFGYVITEGLMEGFNTSSGIAGDPMWLGPTGNIIYGLTNKPYGNNHLVYLGIVLRSNNNNGRVYVKVQNGFEIDELHKVYALNPSNKDTLLYNSGSGAWFARQLNTGDVSGINNYVLNSTTGQFYPSNNPSGFITGVDLTSYATNSFVTGISGSLQNQISSLDSQTGSYVTGQVVRPSETGQFYPISNPSGYATSGSISGSFVTLSTSQNISGVKNFTAAPTISGNQVATVVDPVRTTLTGNGVLSSFAIAGADSLTNPSALIVAIDGALQEPSVDYTVANGNITFTDPLASGAKAVVIAPTNSLQVGVLTPSDGTVTSAKLAPNLTLTNAAFGGTAAFTGTDRPTSAATGSPAATSLITRNDVAARYRFTYVASNINITNTTSLQTALSLPVEAGKTYVIKAVITIAGTANTGTRHGISLPAGFIRLTRKRASSYFPIEVSSSFDLGLTESITLAEIEGFYVCQTSGNVLVQFAQNTAHPDTTACRTFTSLQIMEF